MDHGRFLFFQESAQTSDQLSQIVHVLYHGGWGGGGGERSPNKPLSSPLFKAYLGSPSPPSAQPHDFMVNAHADSEGRSRLPATGATEMRPIDEEHDVEYIRPDPYWCSGKGSPRETRRFFLVHHFFDILRVFFLGRSLVR